ncbi:MAG TPA: histidine phosphatase family protein [Caulobacteraceae bacterium]|jgi:probable phosphoglycerate mutase|nr:histidine phosphatase family protein [Caulobacteraceae bacterium]
MIYLVRHGQTEFNREDRVQGRVDSPLTELGRQQAAAMGERLKALMRDEGGDWTIEVSPLGRARQTAAIIAGITGLAEPRIEQRLIEVGYGVFEGFTREELDARWPEFAGVNGIFGRAPGGEAFDDLSERVAGWLAEAGQRPPGLRTIAVTHAGVARTMRGLYLGLDVEAMRQMDKPQGVIFRLADGATERLECDPLPSAALGG